MNLSVLAVFIAKAVAGKGTTHVLPKRRTATFDIENTVNVLEVVKSCNPLKTRAAPSNRQQGQANFWRWCFGWYWQDWLEIKPIKSKMLLSYL